ncbi:phosphatidate cytidylyltransferase-like protein [Phyllosticta citrichinensis]|uniref:dolichol kinase n=1 Tax=Phyllosticta citrichinensis TaxID=1130410 RepID=A0ABR1Y6W5_9PEZI
MANPDADDPPDLDLPPRDPVPDLLRPDMATTTTTDRLHKLDVSSDDPSALRILSRSPQPYHRRQSQRRQRPRLDTTATAPVQHSRLSSTSASASASASSPDDYDHLAARSPASTGFSGRTPLSRSPHSSESQSQSGSEADDEAYSFVKPLPAPPYRPHKGLMADGATADGESAVVRRRTWGAGMGLGVDSPADMGEDSALLTPSVLEDEGRRLAERLKRARARMKKEGDGEVEVEEDDGVRKERERWLRRRRAELLRRGCEVALLGVIGAIVFAGGAKKRALDLWARELCTFVVVYAFLLLLYPLRLLLSPKDKSIPFKNRVRVPAAFDPAPLLYPAAIPVFVSLSLYPQMQHVLLPNIVLGLAALPARLFPSIGRGAGYSIEHWFFSILPLIVSEHTDMTSKLAPARPYLLKAPQNRVNPETIALLYPLHQALLPPLHYLTTTSLLPSELQLLSVSLINLLLFSKSPQMKILSSILWIGGLLLFILCGPVFRWGVALARIPKWRFRRPGRVKNQLASLLATLKESLRPASQSRTRCVDDSDADEDQLLGYHSDDDRRASIVSASSAVQVLSGAFTTASETFRGAILPSRSGIANGTPSSYKPRRRNTIQTLASESTVTTSISTARESRRRSSRSYASSFLSLTSTQAVLRKWLYALYVYATIALIVLIPLRVYIGTFALNGHDPFGWAIGYLFGNQRRIRFQLFSLGLDAWAALPPLSDPLDPSHLPPAEFARLIALGGPANTRLALAAYDVFVLCTGLVTVLLLLPSTVAVDTRRKIFHATMVAMLLPTVYVDPHFAALATALVLVVFLLLDLLRASTLPPLAKWLGRFLAPFVDGRDLRGPVVVSHRHGGCADGR